ncbi:ABC transporter substrate-binding protein [Humidesulfovibrio sp.]
MRWDKLLPLFLIILCAGSPSFAQDSANTPQGPRVFVVHSYHPEYIWVRAISQGIKESLHSLKPRIDTFYLDAKHDLDPESLRAKAQGLIERIAADKPQVVIAVDDPAQIYLVEPHLKGRNAPQVIFCGVNAPLAKYGFPAPNISGVRERWHFREGFSLMREITPKARRVLFLTDESESSSYVLADLKEDRRMGGRFALPKVDTAQVGTFQQWQRKVLASQTQADILAMGVYLSLRDEQTGKVVPADSVNAWTQKANKLPTLGFADYVLGHGQLTGVIESGHEQGEVAGGMARQVLERGVAAGSLPVRVNQRGVVVVNLKTAERLGIVIPFAIIQAAGVVVQ